MPRPVSYDRDKVIEMAVLQFWQDGFSDCDVETLTKSAGVNRHSLYKSFGGKHGLFLDALEYYISHIAASYLAMLNDGSDLDDLIRYFEMVSGAIARFDSDKAGYDQRGCLIANTVIELGRADPKVTAIIERYYARFERAFTELVERAQAGGTIRAGIDPHAMGRWLMLTNQGLSVAARLGTPARDMSHILRAMLTP